MKILHFSDCGLPDIRVERAALAATENGWEVVFAGGRPVTGQIFNVFKQTRYRHWKPIEKTGFPTSLRGLQNWLKHLIRKEEPDLIHAHDLFAAKVAMDVGYPFVFDDHEIWGPRITRQGSRVLKRERTRFRRLATWYAILNWRKWEPKILRSAPCITVSEEIAELYRDIQPNTFAIPNVPSSLEVNMIPTNRNIDDEFRIAYISRHDLPLGQRRDTEALRVWLEHRFDAKLVFVGPTVIETEEVENHGFVSHQEMLRIITDCDIALMGQKTALPVHSYQNRFPLFLHAGLKTIVPKNKITARKFCDQHKVGWTWDSAQKLKVLIPKLLREYSDNVSKWNKEKTRVRRIANKFLLWKYFEKQLERVYDAVLSTR
jgi:glycosyltransferase involved in cell wall biosynthesis